MDLKEILKDSKFEKYTENFNKKGIFTVQQYYKSKGSGVISEVIADETERMHFSFFMTEKVIIEPSQNKPLPRAPQNEETTSSTKNNSLEPIEIPDKIKDLINFLETNNIVIKASAYEYWDGFCQLKSDTQSDDVKHQSIWNESGDQIINVKEINGKQEVSLCEWAGEGFDLKKKVYEEELCIWANGDVDKDSFIGDLEEFFSDNEGNPDLTYDDFYDNLIEDAPQDSDEAIDIISCTNIKYGCGFSEGEDDFSWHATSYVNQAGIDLSFFKKK